MKLAQKASTHLLNNASGSERIKLALLCCLHAAFQVEFVFDVIHPPGWLVSWPTLTPPPSSPVHNLLSNFWEPARCKVLHKQGMVFTSGNASARSAGLWVQDQD